MNWVDAEVELALSRATTGKPKPFLFIPVLAAEGGGADALPPFAKRYQGVHDPLGNGDELAKLLKAVLDLDWDEARSSSTSPSSACARCARRSRTASSAARRRSPNSSEKFRKHRIVADRRRQRHGQVVAGAGGLRAGLPRRRADRPGARGGARQDLARRDDAAARRSGGGPAAGRRDRREEARPLARRRREPARQRLARRRRQDRLCAAMRPAAGQDLDAADRRSVRGAVHRDLRQGRRRLRGAAAGAGRRPLGRPHPAHRAVRLFQPRERREGRGRQARFVRAPHRRQQRRDPPAEGHVAGGPARGRAGAAEARGCRPTRRRSRRRCRPTSRIRRATCRLLQVALRAAWQEHKATGRADARVLSVGRPGQRRAGEGGGQGARATCRRRIRSGSNRSSSASCGSATPAARRGSAPRSTTSIRRAARCCRNSARTNTDGSSRSARPMRNWRTRR